VLAASCATQRVSRRGAFSMVNRDYTKEVGLQTDKRSLSPVATYSILAVVLGVIAFGVFRVVGAARPDHKAAAPASATGSH
jgi:hypothetical protein